MHPCAAYLSKQGKIQPIKSVYFAVVSTNSFEIHAVAYITTCPAKMESNAWWITQAISFEAQ